MDYLQYLATLSKSVVDFILVLNLVINGLPSILRGDGFLAEDMLEF